MGLFDSLRRWVNGQAKQSVDSPAKPSPTPADTLPGTSDFPFPLVSVHGSQALATWKRLRAEGNGWPVVVGTDEDLAFLREGIEEIEPRSPDEILAAAADLTFPDALATKRAADEERAHTWLRENGHLEEIDEVYEPPLGDWPDTTTPSAFSVAYDVLTGKPHQRVHIAILPCETGWEAIAHLRWGNWNENPPAEYHVAALRNWNARFGAELVSCSHDVIDLHVAIRPATRDAALDLAREQYLYCNDIVDQGTETLSGLAATLMAGDWWYFWWD